jgi:hypothetical protein
MPENDNIINSDNLTNLEDNNLSSAEKILQRIKDKKENSGEETSGIELNENTFEENVNIEDLNSEPLSQVQEISVVSPDFQQITSKESNYEHHKEIVKDYSESSKDDLIKAFNDIINKEDTVRFEKNVKEIKTRYKALTNIEEETRKNKFIEEGGDINLYVPAKDITDSTFIELIKKFDDKKHAHDKKTEDDKKKNLAKKYSIISEINELINKPETFNKTFNKFKDLQKRWNEAGLVPNDDLKTLLDEYNKSVQRFYEYLNVNKELRDLDFKKNYELKVEICERAEELLMETNIMTAKTELQNLHKKWKETGPVSNDIREELWARFQNATVKINEKYSEYHEQMKSQQDKNLESKRFLVEKVQELASAPYENHLDWKEASNKIVEIQKLWKKIGFVPRKYNNEIYNNFKIACDNFFDRIREFYEEDEKHKEDNFQKKFDLCVRAESLKDSNEWIKTSEILRDIQNEWKKIGPVPKEQSDIIWKRFQNACNLFFDRKKEFYKDKKTIEKDNLKNKREIIQKIETFEFSKDQMEDLKKLKQLQNEFLAIGFVPIENKDSIYKQFNEVIDKQLGKLDFSREKQNELRFNENLEIIKNSPKSQRIAVKEITKLNLKLEQLKDDIKVWENNIGFFANSKNSELMVNEIRQKIQEAKNNVTILENQIDELENIQD